MKRLLLTLASIAAVVGCTDFETDSVVARVDSISIPVKVEATSTRSFLYDDDTQWTFCWQNGDVLKYAVLRGGSVFQTGPAVIVNNGDSWSLEIADANTLALGDVIYSYYCPTSESTNIRSLDFAVPASQLSEMTTETEISVVRLTTAIASPSLDKTSASASSSSSSVVPSSRTLKFRINGLDATKTYYYKVGSGSAKRLSAGSDGRYSVSVAFPSVSYKTQGNGRPGSTSNTANGSATVVVSVYPQGHEDATATIPVTVNATRTKSTSWFSSSYSYSFAYSLGAATSGTEESFSQTEGETHLTPLRDAMVIVADPVVVTSSLLDGTLALEDQLSFHPLGSLVECRIYSGDAAVGVGEQIESVTFTATGANIAGSFEYDLVANPLTISGLTESAVVSHVESLDYAVNYGKDNAQSVYMVVAPGTYAASLDILTDQAHYEFAIASKAYSRNVKKPYSVNLASSSCTRTSLFPEEPDEPEEPEQPEEPDDPVVSAPVYAMFSTDRHSNIGCNGKTGTTESGNMNQSWMYNILSYISTTYGYDVSLVSFGGDMVGDIGSGSSKPTANTSSFKNEVTAVYPDAQVVAIKAAHDSNVSDNAGILYSTCQAIDCGEYYIYALPQDYMSSASSAQTAANAFVNWASTVDPSKPIIVDSHMPTIKKRSDNAGATAWHNAMNQVATGSANGTTVVRDVIFFSGHNHTVDQNEYYYAPGSTMAVQGTSSNVTIYYTYSVCGYLASGYNATLMTLTDDEITLEKYCMTGRVVTSSNHPDYNNTTGTKHVITRHK